MKYLLVLLWFLVSATFASAQEAILVDVLSNNHPCGDFIARMDRVYNEYKEAADAKIYVIYYEGKHKSYGETKKFNPRKGDALNRAKEISLYLTEADYRAFKLPKDKVILVDGGYKKDFSLEIWIVPKNADSPKLTPILEEKDIKFSKGKQSRVRDYGECY